MTTGLTAPRWDRDYHYSTADRVFYDGDVWTATRANVNNKPGRAVDAKDKAWAQVHLTPYEQALNKADQTAKAKRYERELHAGIAESRRDPPPSAPDGLKVTLSSIGGLTVDKQGRSLLPQAFVFQCGPLEQYTVAHNFNMGTYDTIDDDQFARRGSRQLDTWQFDSLAMYLGSTNDGKHYLPGWVPYPTKMPGGQQYRRPEWYVEQLRTLFDAGAPFRYVCAFKDSTTIHRTFALLTAFNEDYRHGEGDTIYLSAVSFMEWRDPRGSTARHHHQQSARLPARVYFKESVEIKGGPFIAWDDQVGQVGTDDVYKRPVTLCDLAHFYYHDPGEWRTIAQANKFHGGSGNAPIYQTWGPKGSKKPTGWFLTVPQKPPRKPAEQKVTKQRSHR